MTDRTLGVHTEPSADRAAMRAARGREVTAEGRARLAAAPAWPRRFRSLGLAPLRGVPFRIVAPNAITVLALCCGLTAALMAVHGRYELAVLAVWLAVALDCIDGLVARLLHGTSKFGAELDSLADFVSFGVAPGMILYFFCLERLGAFGWIAALVFATAIALRLARFNVMIDDPTRPGWMKEFFVGMPAPAVAGTALLPLNLGFLGLADIPAGIVAAYVLALAALAVSTVPVYAGKNRLMAGWKRAAVPGLAGLAVVIGLLIAYPWTVLTVLAAAYLAGMPAGFVYHRRLKRRLAAPAPLHAPGYGGSGGVLAPAAAGVEQAPKG